MTRLERKCFVGSATLHGLLFVVFLFGSAFLSSARKQPTLAVIQIVGAIPTDRMISTGGSPTGTPTPPAPAPAPAPVQAPPPTPPPPVERKPEPVVSKPEPVAPKPEVVKKPEPEPVKPVKPPKIAETVREVPKQHGDFAVKPKKTTEKKEKEKEKESESEPVRQISKKLVRRNTNDVARLAQEQQERDMQEARLRAAAQAKREYNERLAAYNRQQAAISSQVNGLVNGVGKDLGKTTVVTPLGDGGKAYVNYGSLIREIYERAWVEPPALVDDDGTVKAEITIARNGKIIGTKVIRKSGTPALDKSIERALNSVRVVPPFPPDSSDAERTFTINFNLKAKRMST